MRFKVTCFSYYLASIDKPHYIEASDMVDLRKKVMASAEFKTKGNAIVELNLSDRRPYFMGRLVSTYNGVDWLMETRKDLERYRVNPKTGKLMEMD